MSSLKVLPAYSQPILDGFLHLPSYPPFKTDCTNADIESYIKELENSHNTLNALSLAACGANGLHIVATTLGDNRPAGVLSVPVSDYNQPSFRDIETYTYTTDQIPQLTSALTSESYRVQRYAVFALSKVGEEALPFLLEVLKDGESYQLRTDAAVAIGLLSDKAENYTDQIFSILEQEEYVGIRITILESLRKIEPTTPGLEQAIFKEIALLNDAIDRESPRGYSQSYGQRQQLYKELGKLSTLNPLTLTALLQDLNSLDPTICSDVSLALGEIGESQSRVISALVKTIYESPYEACAISAVHALGEIGINAYDSVPFLLPLLDFHDEYISDNLVIATVESLAKISPENSDFIDSLIKNFQDRSTIRREVAKSLGISGSKAKDAIPILLSEFDNTIISSRDDLLLLDSISAALGQIAPSDPNVVETLISALENDSLNELHPTLVEALGKSDFPNSNIVDALITKWNGLSDDYLSYQLGRTIADVLSEIAHENKEVSHTLSKHLHELNHFLTSYKLLDDDRDVRSQQGQLFNTIKIIGAIGLTDSRAVSILISTFNQRYYAQTAAVEALGKNQNAIPDLIEALTDERDLVRRRSAEALAMIGDSAIPQLLIALEDERSRYAAAYALAIFESPPQSAIQHLLDIVNNKNYDLYDRWMAAVALDRMDVDTGAFFSENGLIRPQNETYAMCPSFAAPTGGYVYGFAFDIYTRQCTYSRFESTAAGGGTIIAALCSVFGCDSSGRVK